MKRGTTPQRELLSRLKARIEDIDEGRVQCSTQEEQDAWRRRIASKIIDLEEKGVEPLTPGLSDSRLEAGHGS